MTSPGLEEELTAAKALLDSLYDRIIEITGTGRVTGIHHPAR